MNSILTSKWTKAVVFLACLIPAGILIYDFFTGGLGGNPTQFLEHGTGDWALRFIALTLSISPLRKILRQPQLIRFRRMLGLFAFFTLAVISAFISDLTKCWIFTACGRT